MNKSLRRLDSVHQKLLDTVSPLEAELFSRRPSTDEWSVAEIVQHLYLVEERVIKDLKQAIARDPQTVGLLKRLIPTSIVVEALEGESAQGCEPNRASREE